MKVREKKHFLNHGLASIALTKVMHSMLQSKLMNLNKQMPTKPHYVELHLGSTFQNGKFFEKPKAQQEGREVVHNVFVEPMWVQKRLSNSTPM